jgi:hypothetical protein
MEAEAEELLQAVRGDEPVSAGSDAGQVAAAYLVTQRSLVPSGTA